MSTAAVPSLLLPDSSLRIESLRALLPAPLPQAPGLPTGLEALDEALASGGLPRGRLTEVVGASGKLTLLRPVVAAAVRRGEWVAYIDASRTLAPRDWAETARDHALWIVRPPEPTKAAWCADVLLRSGSFALVVLDSAPPISRAIAVRLMGLARESNAAFVVVAASGATRLGGAARLRVHRRRHRLRIAIEKGARISGGGGGQRQRVVEVACADGVARRLCANPAVPDRRGVQREAPGKRDGRRAATPDFGRGKSGGMLRYC
ncbi:MAG: hypothetical protein ACRENU_02090 [Gemmatimonadaceae bacterium]